MRSILLGFVLMLLCVSAWAVNVPFASPPFDSTQFNVDQPGNKISLKTGSIIYFGAVNGLVYTQLNGTNYYGINTNGSASGYVLTFSNGIPSWQPPTGGGGGTSTNLLPLNNTWTGTNTWSANTNEFSFALHSGSLYVGSGLFSVSTAGNLKANSIVDAGSFSADAGQFFSDGIGNVTAMSFSGIGTSLTALNASQLTSGTVPAARLPLATSSAFGAIKPDNTTITVSSGILSAVGSSSTITNLAGGNQIIVTNSGGTNIISVDPTVAITNTSAAPSVFQGSIISSSGSGFIGVGSGLTALNASQLTSGTIPYARLPLGVVTNGIYTNSGPNIVINNTLFLNTNGFGGSSSSGLPTINGNGTNETFWGLTTLTNSTSGNGVTFDGTSLILNSVNLNTAGAGSISGNAAGALHLNASAMDNGTLSTARLESTVLTNLVGTSASTPSVSGHTGLIPTNSASSSAPSLYGAAMRGYFLSGTNIPTAGGSSGVGLSVGDFNNDGWPDVVASGSTSFGVYTNNKLGAFPRSFNQTGFTSARLNSIADVNGDGKIDIIVSDNTAGTVSVYTNKGDATFVQLGSTYAETTAQFTVAGDFNNDGKPDFIAVSSVNSVALTIYTNTGNG